MEIADAELAGTLFPGFQFSIFVHINLNFMAFQPHRNLSTDIGSGRLA